MNKQTKWHSKTSYQQKVIDTKRSVYITIKKIMLSLQKNETLDLYDHKELEIIFANIRV